MGTSFVVYTMILKPKAGAPKDCICSNLDYLGTGRGPVEVDVERKNGNFLQYAWVEAPTPSDVAVSEATLGMTEGMTRDIPKDCELSNLKIEETVKLTWVWNSKLYDKLITRNGKLN